MWRIILSSFFFLSECNYNPPDFSFSGGYENFHSQYPELCTEVKAIDHSGTETEKRVNSQTETRCHHKPDYDQVWKHPIQLPTLPRKAQIRAQLRFLFLKPPSKAQPVNITEPHPNIHFISSDLYCSRTLLIWPNRETHFHL